MSDMPDRSFMPPAADHERHDALLVAQFAAGDTLEPDRRAEAERLVAGCGACAALASDLRAVSRAVAREPAPPRRRDFYLSPAQAESLSGTALTRFLRRFALPSALAFQPAAAGVLSVGLLFVVAGYAWPDGGTVVVQAEPNFAVYGTAAPALEPDGELAPPPAAADLDEGELAPPPAEADLDEGEPAAPLADADLDERAMADALEAGVDPEFFETLPEHQAGTADRFNQKSMATEAEQSEEAAAQRATDAQAAAEAPAEAPADESLVTADELEALTDDAAPAPAPVDESLGAADALEAGVDDEAPVRAPRAAAPEPKAETEPVGDGAAVGLVAQTVPDEGGPEDLLVALGVLLALTGGGLLVLGWLARRSRDPLAP